MNGLHGLQGHKRPARLAGVARGVLFAAAVGLILAAPVLALTGLLEPFAALEGAAAHALGIGLYSFGLGGTLVAQGAMGSSWRVGVDASEKTDLVTGGPFVLVRNPIFAAMIPAVLGLALLVPNIAVLAGLLSLVAAVELQVRFVEEPYLSRTHGEGYASRVGRFVPGVGYLKVTRVRKDA